ncbi:MAG TPA: glycosyltransferase, partial [Myxococcota bacterium]|nr:glycosyltransferase [Myxococcota bacterium]
MPIPPIVHQTWRDREIPARWLDFHASWRRHHPAWTHRLWTDDELRALVAAEAPWLLPIYDAYPDPIERVDVARVVVLRACGGLYVDLDYECLRPHDALLADHELALALEPDVHARQRGLSRLVCNAWMASAPRHPFWDHVLARFVREAHHPGALEATGPVMLTRCVQTWRRPLHLLPAERVCPLDSHATDVPPEDAHRLAALCPPDAVALHHWSGSWWRGRTLPHPVELLDGGRRVVHGVQQLAELPPLRDGPLVSCLLVTRGRRAQAELAVRCFEAQTWRARELVVVDDDPDPALR